MTWPSPVPYSSEKGFVMYDDNVNPVKGVAAYSTEHMAAVIVLGALVYLYAIRRGFRGLNLGGASVRVG